MYITISTAIAIPAIMINSRSLLGVMILYEFNVKEFAYRVRARKMKNRHPMIRRKKVIISTIRSTITVPSSAEAGIEDVFLKVKHLRISPKRGKMKLPKYPIATAAKVSVILGFECMGSMRIFHLIARSQCAIKPISIENKTQK